jgi:hypothetical protein
MKATDFLNLNEDEMKKFFGNAEYQNPDNPGVDISEAYYNEIGNLLLQSYSEKEEVANGK